MIIDAFNSDVYVQNKMDVQHTPIYDTITVAAGQAVTPLSTQLFTNVGAGSNKTINQTNMQQSQKLAAPEAFSIFGFRIRWAENILMADLLSIMNGFVFEFYLGQKYYQRAPLWHYNAGGGIGGFFTTTATSVLTNGTPGRESMHKLAIPIVIENQMTFYALLNGPSYTTVATGSGGTGLTLQVLLDGFYARGVQ